jgi:hypothetical protein
VLFSTIRVLNEVTQYTVGRHSMIPVFSNRVLKMKKNTYSLPALTSFISNEFRASDSHLLEYFLLVCNAESNSIWKHAFLPIKWDSHCDAFRIDRPEKYNLMHK